MKLASGMAFCRKNPSCAKQLLVLNVEQLGAKKKKVPCCHLMYAYEAMSDDQIHCLSLYWFVQWLHPQMADIHHQPDCRRSSLQQRCIHHNWCEISDCTGKHDDCMTKWPTATTSTTMGVLHTVAAMVRTLQASWNAIIPTLHIAPPTKKGRSGFFIFTFFFWCFNSENNVSGTKVVCVWKREPPFYLVCLSFIFFLSFFFS